MIGVPSLVGCWPEPGGVADIAELKQRLEAVAAPPGTVLVSTCQRVELYLEATQPMPLAALAALLGVSSDWLVSAAPVAQRTGAGAVEHLLRVAAGLESAVLGEDQVLAQVRSAYSAACAQKTPGPVLHRLFHTALRTGKRVRNETTIARGNTSLAGAAVSAVKRHLGGVRGRTVLLVGAGEMNRIAADGLHKAGARRVLVTSRTMTSAQELAEPIAAEVLPWSWRAEALAGVDACITATGAPAAVIDGAAVERASNGRADSAPLVVVDLAVPCDVAVDLDCLPGGLLYENVATLAAAMRRDQHRRLGEVAAAEAIVREEVASFGAWLGRRSTIHLSGGRLRA